MVLQFVGFVGAWQNPEGLSPLLAATLGALLTTWATFTPCFLWIFLGGPYIEKLRGNVQLRTALSAITATIVGVILNLAIVFGVAVIWPRGFLRAPDLISVALGVAAFVALYRFKANILWIILTGGLIGLTRVLVAS